MNFKTKGAKWLWDNCECIDNQYVCFRQELDVKKIEKAYISLCCDTTYELYVNGTFVNFGQYLAMPENKFFDKLDITEYLKKGKNVIAVEVYYQGRSSSCYAKGTPGLIYFTEIDGKVYPNDGVKLTHDGGYTEGELPLISSQLGPSFEFDARSAEDWKNPDFVPNDKWKNAVVFDFDNILTEDIKPRPVEKFVFSERADFRLANRGEFSYTDEQKALPVAHRMQQAAMCMTAPCNDILNTDIVVDKDNTSLIFDLGSETAGYFELDVTTDSETVFDISYGEHLTDLRVRSAIGNRNFAFTYTSKAGHNYYANFFRRLAGRYIQMNIRGVKEKCVIHCATLRKAEYPVKFKEPICIDDRLHKKIYEVCINSLRQCMHEHYEDCPWREQSLYAFDSRNQILAGYSVFENHKFAKACLELLDSTLGEDGYQKICAPKEDELKIPGFSVMWIVAVCEYIQNTGRAADMKKLLVSAEKMLDIYLGNVNGEGVVLLPSAKNFWFFYDWADGLSGSIKMFSDDTPDEQVTDAVFNLEICYALKKMIDVCESCKIDAAKYKKYHKNLKAAVNKHFFDNEKKLYKTFEDKDHYCQLVQSLAILSDVAVNKKQLRKALVNDESLVKTTLSTMALRYEALMQDESYLDFIMDEIADIWGGMLYKGATTFYETEIGEADFHNAGSLCHGWSAIPLIVYKKYYIDQWLDV